MLNVDDSGYLWPRRKADATPERLDAAIAHYRNPAITDVLFCVASQRTNVQFQTPTWEPVWADLDGWRQLAQSGQARRKAGKADTSKAQAKADQVEIAEYLHEQGIDPYARWLAQVRDWGKRAWVSIRMNDQHFIDDLSHPLHNSFWRQRSDLWRRPWRMERAVDYNFDFAQDEVRQRMIELITELCARYRFDGLELDWMRAPFHFAPGMEQAGAPLLTDMIAQVRRLLHEANPQAQLGVRVPSTVPAARAFGLDAVTWIRRGLVDMICPTPQVTVNNDIPVEQWAALLQDSDIALCPAAIHAVAQYPPRLRRERRKPMKLYPDVVRGVASSMWQRGADRMYLYNMYNDRMWDDPDAYHQLLHDASGAPTLTGRPRRHLVTYDDAQGPGCGEHSLLPMACGAAGNLDHRVTARTDTAELRVYTGTRPTDAERVELRLAYAGGNVSCGDRLYIPEDADVRVNGRPCQFIGAAQAEEPTPADDLWAYAVPNEVMQAGYNLIEVLPTRQTTIEWAEFAFSGDQ